MLGRCLADSQPIERAVRRGLAVARWHDGETVVVRAFGSEQFEISCHGGQAAVKRLLADLERAGAAPAAAEELLGGESVFDRELAACLAHAPSSRAAFMLTSLKERWLSLIDALRTPNGRAKAVELLQRVAERAHVGLRLLEPWRIVLAGRPNVGKSSLLNAVVGYARAVVHEQAGTTRDIVREEVIFQGWPLIVHDTAGLRTSDHPVEREGVRRAEQLLAQADLVWLVLDGSQPLTEADQALIAKLPEAVVVVNKVDLPPAWQPEALPATLRPLRVSARSGQGVRALLCRTLERLIGKHDPLADRIPCAVTQRQVRLVREAAACAKRGELERATAALEQLVLQ